MVWVVCEDEIRWYKCWPCCSAARKCLINGTIIITVEAILACCNVSWLYSQWQPALAIWCVLVDSFFSYSHKHLCVWVQSPLLLWSYFSCSLFLAHWGLRGLCFIFLLEAGLGSRMRGHIFIATFHLHVGPVPDGVCRSRRLVRSPWGAHSFLWHLVHLCVFCISRWRFVLLVIEKGVFKSLNIIVDLPISPRYSSMFCFIYFETLLLGA